MVDQLIIPNLPFIVIEGSKDAWINFFGALFGGMTTLIALVFTIKYENQKMRREDIKFLRPFIISEPILKDDYNDMDNIENDTYINSFSIRVENVSNNLLKDLQLVSETRFGLNEETGKYDLDLQELVNSDKEYYNIYTVLLEDSKIIAPNRYYDFHTNLVIPHYSENSDTSFYIKVLFKYRDAMDKMEYFHQLEYILNVNYSSTGELQLFISDVKNKIIKTAPIKYKN